MRPLRSLFAGLLALLVSSCASEKWSRLASEAAVLQQVRANQSTAVSCDPQPARLGDYAFSVQCGPATIYLRCGYHHRTTCCWPVETSEAATNLFGRDQHSMAGQVCDPL